MKYLKRFNESSDNKVSYIYNIRDILLDLDDLGYTTRVLPFNDWRTNISSSESDGISVEITNPSGFGLFGSTKPKDDKNINECFETILRVIDYMKQEGYKPLDINLTSYNRPGFPTEFHNLKTKIINNEFIAYPLNKKRVIPIDRIAKYHLKFIKQK